MFFHEEVHGANSSLFSEMGNWRGGITPSVVPKPNMQGLTMYMNRICEIAWLITRLLPYLQLEENAFGEEWHRKHDILDDSFRHVQESMSASGKKIGDAFIEFVDKKFSFKKPFYYFEADGRG